MKKKKNKREKNVVMLETKDKSKKSNIKVDDSLENDLSFNDVKDNVDASNDKLMKKNLVFLFIFVCVIGLLYFFFFRSVISFKYSETHLSVDVLSEFSVPSVTACYGNRFKCKSIDVIVDSNVDTSKIGSYRIVYSAKKGKKSKKFVLNVDVVDQEAPIIDVLGDSLSVCPNATDYNIDFKAFDNYDGDLTSSVSKEVALNVLTLSVSDSSGNSATKDISIVREDLEAPVITINGNDHVYLSIGSSYSDSGASATDVCDGDLTSNIDVSGSVDTSRAGNYSINYSVSDSSGNVSNITRTVSVYAPNGNGDKVVYLTFDDGPSAYTGELLDVLAKYNVKATFFVTNRAPLYNHFIKRAYDEGHTIALHTSSHNYSLVYSSVDAYFNDLNAINETVFNITGNYSYLIRFPGGSSNTVSRKYSVGIMSTLSRMVTERGYKYFDWNVSSGDADGSTYPSSVYYNNIVNGISNKSMSIVLQHDTNVNSIRAVGSVIEYGLSHGYSFKSLDINSPTVHHGIAN